MAWLTTEKHIMALNLVSPHKVQYGQRNWSETEVHFNVTCGLALLHGIIQIVMIRGVLVVVIAIALMMDLEAQQI